jgi:hypothetical protein
MCRIAFVQGGVKGQIQLVDHLVGTYMIGIHGLAITTLGRGDTTRLITIGDLGIKASGALTGDRYNPAHVLSILSREGSETHIRLIIIREGES